MQLLSQPDNSTENQHGKNDQYRCQILLIITGQWVELSSSELVVGDQIRLEAGDRVPADLRLTGATDLFVSQ